MKKLSRWLAKLLGGTTAIVGAIMVVWPTIEMYYLYTGRMQPDMETLTLTGAGLFIVLGSVLMILGYILQK